MILILRYSLGCAASKSMYSYTDSLNTIAFCFAQAVAKGQDAIAAQCVAIEAWAAEIGKAKREAEILHPPEELDNMVMQMIGEDLKKAYRTIQGKKERGEVVAALKEKVRDMLVQQEDVSSAKEGDLEGTNGSFSETIEQKRYSAIDVSLSLKRVESAVMRSLVLKEGHRADGRGVDEVRPIWSRTGLLPRTHGSALFTRGETQALAVTTLGT